MLPATAAACTWPQLRRPGGLSECRAAFGWPSPSTRDRPARSRCEGFPSSGACASQNTMVVIVTPATSIVFSRPELDDFLYALIAMERNEMPLSVLSALARLDLDPWKEAAELSELPRDSAAQRLALLILRLPGGRWTLGEAGEIAHRLIELLPLCSSPSVARIGSTSNLPSAVGLPAARMLLCAALVIALIAATRCDPSSGADMVAHRTTEAAPHSPLNARSNCNLQGLRFNIICHVFSI
jgi:hypothetical protein